MDPDKIAQLANLLRESGNKLLNDNFKLTLSGQLLQALNDSFSLIVDKNESTGGAHSFQVVTANNYSKSFVFRDLQLIFDFVQKTHILCVTHFSSDEPFVGAIDISNFRNLRRLEICRVSVNQVRGIQAMRPYLQEIRCVHSVDRVEDIISHCGGDKSNGFIWNDLRVADFSYNTLRAIDGSLEFASWLQHLNLSHNQIVSVDAIKWLPNLKYLNLSFNRLPHIPFFNLEATRRLKVLILSNNYIEELTGISRLDALNELDLSGNYLLDHSTLLPLSTLVALQCLSLIGNPLACHPKHRQATSRYLHKNTASVKFLLDGEMLSKSEKAQTGKQQSMLTNRMPVFAFGRRSNSQASSRLGTKDNTPSSSIGSLRSFQLEDSRVSTDDTSVITSHKKLRPKPVVIAEHPPEHNVPTTATGSSKADKAASTLDGNKDHLETKKQIEMLRSQHGDSWLQNHGANMGQLSPQLTTTSSNRRDEASIVDDNMDSLSFGQSDTTLRASTPLYLGLDGTTIKSDSSAYQTANDNDNLSTSTLYKSTDEPSPSIADHHNDMEHIFPQSTVDEPEPLSDAEDNEVTYIVTIEQTQEDLFLIVSDTNIREKDSLTGRTITKWSVKTLESCERTKADVLHLQFDTVKRDKQERIYRVEPGLCQQLEKYLRGILAQRPLSEMNLTMYRCVKCSVNFSRETKGQALKKAKSGIVCPNCNCDFVVEVVETPPSTISIQPEAEIIAATPSVTSVKTDAIVESITDDAKGLEKTESQSSIGSVHSLNGSSSCSKISKSASSCDSNQSVAGSSERDSDSLHCTDSDVEIVSNPSQSSIEVLEYNATSRKHSEDRRYSDTRFPPDMIMSLDSMAEQINRLVVGEQANVHNQRTSTQDLLTKASKEIERDLGDLLDRKTVLSQVHLTESSSSGSVTDSICTTYEQSNTSSPLVKSVTHQIDSNPVTPNGGATKQSPTKQMIEAVTTPTKADTSMISSMFGGLFQSTNNLMSRSQRSPTGAASSCDPFHFNYTQFDEVDHRLKLFLYAKLFEDDNEQLMWLVKGEMVADKWSGSGIFVLSTTKFYVLQVIGAECDDVSKWVRRQISGTIDRLETVRVLPWKIGFAVSIKAIGTFQLVLQDILRTDSLLLFLNNNPLPDWCALEYQVDENLAMNLLAAASNEPLKMLAILNTFTITADGKDDIRKLVGLIVTENHLRILPSIETWLTATDRNASFECQRTQLMSNLVDIEMLSDREVRINYLDEIDDTCELWCCQFETADSANSTLNAIEQSWSKLFGVPLTQPK